MQTHRRSSIGLGAIGDRTRTLLALAATIGAIAALGAMPAAQASASSSTSGLSGLTSGLDLPVSLQLPDGELEPILSQLPIGELGLSDTELSEILSEVSEGLLGGPLLGEVGGKLSTLVDGLLQGNPEATLGELVSSVNGLVSGLLGKSIDVGQLLEALNPAQTSKALEGLLSSEGIVKLLSGLAGRLEELGAKGAQSLDGVLADLLSSLPGGPGVLAPGIAQAVEEVGQTGLRPTLETLKSTGSLSGEGLSELEGLLGKLGSLSPTGLQEGLSELLGALSPTQATTLLGSLFGALSPTQVQGIVQDLLGGLGTLTPTKTVSELASTTGTNATKLSEELGSTASTLPEPLPAVSGSLLGKEGAVMSLVDTTGGLLGSLGKGSEPGSGGGSGGSGGAGGAGSQGSGGGGSSSGLTLAVNVPTQVFSQTTPSSTQKAGTTSGTKAGKLRILGEKVKGEVATIVLGIPGAGRLRLTGKYMKTDTRNLLRAQRLVVRMKLAKAGIASLAHGHRRNLKVHLSATFTPTKGARTSAGAALTFHSRSA